MAIYFRLIFTIFGDKKLIFFILAIFLAVFLVAKPAEAGLFSFLGDWLGINNENKKLTPLNIQTLPLLEAIYNPDPNNGRGGGDITIINNALLPDSGPMGTMVDISENKPSPDQISVYVVRQGDTLTEIADMFNVSVNTIRWANDLKSGELIKIGQVLVILPVTGVQYTVKKGDTIKSIAKKFSADVNEILQFNNLTLNDVLNEGQTVIIPNGDYAEPESSQTPIYSRIPYTPGYYIRPIESGRKSQGLHGYNAVDLADSCGEPVIASASGDVIITRSYGWNAGYGNYLVISHPNGTQTLYAHLSKIIVFPSWHVAQGQIIGYIGATGRTTGCHVHFEIRGAKNPF